MNYSLELDISNYFPIDKEKRIRCEECNKEIKPVYKFSTETENYYYECNNLIHSPGSYKSQGMSYVEFKYFLRDNGVIKF